MAETTRPLTKRGIRWGFILPVVGLAALFTAYYWVHLNETTASLRTAAALPAFVLEFPAAFAAAVLRGIPDLLTVALLVLTASGLGELLLNRWIPAEGSDAVILSPAERLVMGAMLGLGLLSIGALGLGLLGLYRGEILWFGAALTILLTHRGLLRWLRLVAAAAVGAMPRSPVEGLLMGFVMFALFAALLIALAPPFTWDAMTYHLVAPARYLRDGAIRPYADNTYLGFSQGVETLYGVVISLFGRDTAAAPLHWVYGGLALIGVAGFMRRIASRTAASAAVALLLSAYSLWLLFGDPYVDLALLAYSSCLVSVLSIWVNQRHDRWLVLLGVLGGLAMGVKYTAGIYLAAGVLVVIVTSPRQMLRSVLVISVAAVLVFAPWMLRGWLLWGNPLYPFVFGGLAWDGLRSTALSAAGAGMIAQGTAWQLLMLPLSATIFGVDSITPYDFSTGPLLLTMGGFLVVAWQGLALSTRQIVQVCMLLLAPVIFVWMITSATSGVGAQPRLVVMAFVPFAMLGALALHGLRDHPLRWFLSGALAVALGMSLLGMIGLVRGTAVVAYAQTGDREAYLNHNLGVHMGAMEQLGTLPAGSRVRVLFDPMGYYCPGHITCAADLLFDQWGRPLKSGESPDDVLAVWKTDTDYVLLFNAGLDYWKVTDVQYRAENALLPETITRWMTPIWEDSIGAYTLYVWR